MKSLRGILIFRYIALAVIVLLGISAALTFPLRSQIIKTEKEKLIGEARSISVLLSVNPDLLESNHLEDLTDSISEQLLVRITITDTEGNVIADSETNISALDNHAGRPEIASALKGEDGISERRSRSTNESYIYAATPVWKNGNVIATVRTASNISQISSALMKTWQITVAGLLLISVSLTAMAFWTQKTIEKSLSGLREASSAIASGDFSKKAPAPSIKDFSDLAVDINHMAESVRSTLKEIIEEKTKLEVILENISIGIMVTDDSGKITLLNSVAEIILGIRQADATGKRPIEINPSPELDLAVAKSCAGESISEKVVLLRPNQKTVEFTSNPVILSSGIIIGTVSILEDITKKMRLENTRKDFVANVSHELRTPISSIKALTEALASGAKDDSHARDYFIGDLEHEVNRMARLIEDLLSLSKLESTDAEFPKEDINLEEIIESIMNQKEPMARENDIGLSAKIDLPENFSFKGHRHLMGAAVLNLTDNALKYNNPGGSVEISCFLEGDSLQIEFSDSGIGIKMEDIDRIFERFYRVDKARSRETGGTGLGLSIVKHIMEIHGGHVTVESTYGNGSVFTLSFPAQ